MDQGTWDSASLAGAEAQRLVGRLLAEAVRSIDRGVPVSDALYAIAKKLTWEVTDSNRF